MVGYVYSYKTKRYLINITIIHVILSDVDFNKRTVITEQLIHIKSMMDKTWFNS